MVTKTYKLKLVLNEQKKDKLYRAYGLFNEYVAFFERFLLTARGMDYYYTDNGTLKYKTKDEVAREIEGYLAQSQSIKNREECVWALHQLSEIVSQKGSQVAGALTQLYNSSSSAGLATYDKIIDPLPDFCSGFNLKERAFIDEKYRNDADAWIASERGRQLIEPLLAGVGRPSAFKLAYLESREWYGPFILDQMKFRKECEDGLAKVLSILKENGLIPILKIPPELYENHSVWIRLILKIALESFASYVSCDLMTRSNYELKSQRFGEAEKIINSNYPDELDKICNFFENQGTENEIGGHYLTRGMCRGIDKLRTACVGQDEDERANTLRDFVKNGRLNSVGISFFEWAIRDENFSVINEMECVDALLQYFDAKRELDEAKRCSSYTVADGIHSRRYLFYEQMMGTNYKKYVLECDNDNHLSVRFPVLLRASNNHFFEDTICAKIAQHASLIPIGGVNAITCDKKDVYISFRNCKRIKDFNDAKPKFETFCGILGGADIHVDLSANGVISAAYLSIAMNFNKKCSSEFEAISNAMVFHYATAYSAAPTKYETMLYDKNLRAMSVHLGVEQFGAGAVYSHRFEKGSGNLSADFERDFILKLDGEKVDRHVRSARTEEMNSLRRLEHQIDYLPMLRNWYKCIELDRLHRQIARYCNSGDKDKVARLSFLLHVEDREVINKFLSEEYDAHVRYLHSVIASYREPGHTRIQKRNYAPGISLFAVEYLEFLRRVLMKWGAQRYRISDVTLIGNGAYETRLLSHINNIKRERIVSGSSMLVMSALGYVYEHDAWVKRYDRCNVIIFGDLSKYRTDASRTNVENSMLSRWSHREIVAETKRQAALYGIVVYDSVEYSYSARMYHENSAPGIRARMLNTDDFENGLLNKDVEKQLPSACRDFAGSLKVGDLIPDEAGDYFVTLDSDGKLVRTNTSMNIAKNLQKKFFSRHSELLKLDATIINGNVYLDTDDEIINNHKRLNGGLVRNYGSRKLSIVSDEKGVFRCVPYRNDLAAHISRSDGAMRLMRDSSGVFFDCNAWIPADEYWRKVTDGVASRLLSSEK